MSMQNRFRYIMGAAIFGLCGVAMQAVADVGDRAGASILHPTSENFQIESGRLVLWSPAYQGIAVVPHGVRRIGSDTFALCDGVTGVVFPETLDTIESRAFTACGGLREIVVPSTVTNIGDRAFEACDSLTNLVIRPGIGEVPDAMCANCARLQCVELPEGVHRIGDDAFRSCRSLRRVVIPSSVESIGKRAFSGCGRLREVVCLGNVRKIGENVFLGCYDLAAMPANSPSVAVAMKSCVVGSQDSGNGDPDGLKKAIRIAAEGFALNKVEGAVDINSMDAFAESKYDIRIGTGLSDVERCIAVSGAGKTVFHGPDGVDEISVDFGMYGGELVKVKMRITEGKVSSISFSESLKKGVRLGLESRGEEPDEKMLKWL